MLKITLNSDEINVLHESKKRRDIPSDRITAILLINEGFSAIKVAKILNLNPNTVRGYVKSYIAQSINGLSRKYSKGRPSDKKIPLIAFLKVCLQNSPTDYGWDKSTWDSTSIIESFKKDSGLTVSHDTVTRGMKELGYSYKRPQKSPSVSAPSKEEKLKTVNTVIDLIKRDLDIGSAEVYCCDESHFTNEPYLPRGYFLKGSESINSHSKKAGDKKPIWLIKSTKWKVFLEKC